MKCVAISDLLSLRSPPLLLDSQLSGHLFVLWTREGFGEDVGEVVCASDVLEGDGSFFSLLLMDVVMLHLDVSGFRLDHSRADQRQRPEVVDHDSGSARDVGALIPFRDVVVYAAEQLAQPGDFPNGFAAGDIFAIGSGSRTT